MVEISKSQVATWHCIWTKATPKELHNRSEMARKFDCTWHVARKYMRQFETMPTYEPKAEIVVQAFDPWADLLDLQATLAGLAVQAESHHNTCKYLADIVTTTVDIVRDSTRIYELQAQNEKLTTQLNLARQQADNSLAEAKQERELRIKQGQTHGEATGI